MTRSPSHLTVWPKSQSNALPVPGDHRAVRHGQLTAKGPRGTAHDGDPVATSELVALLHELKEGFGSGAYRFPRVDPVDGCAIAMCHHPETALPPENHLRYLLSSSASLHYPTNSSTNQTLPHLGKEV
jgi:hypothetical protein